MYKLPNKDTLVRFDWAIKYLLRNKKNFDILEGFLSELLDQDIEILNILESESNPETLQDKYNRVDLLAETREKEKIIIEVQCSRQFDYLNRILYGTSKVIAQSLNKGEAYEEISKVISVSILYFDLGQGKDYIYKGRTQFHGLHYHDTLGLSKEEKRAYKKLSIKTPENIFPEYYLIKINQFDQRIQNNLDEWIYLLKNSAVKQEFTAKGIKAAEEKLRIMQLNDQERINYDAYVKDLHQEASMIESHYGRGKRHGLKEGEAKGRIAGLEEGKLEGLKEGEVKGKLEAKLETAAKLLAMGMDKQQVAEATGLSVDQLNS